MNRLVEPLPAVLDRASSSWASLVQDWRQSPAGRGLEAYVAARQAAGATVFPNAPLRALDLPPQAVRVVILGQDPYHGAGQAEGLAFSVPHGVRVPPSLRNVFAELARDLGLPCPDHGQLGRWAQRGVLLLNSVLTVEEGLPCAHANRGWEALTDRIIETVVDEPSPTVFMLWGSAAQSKAGLIERGARPGRLVLRANHPSPLSARRPPLPFIGCGHFGAARRFFAEHGCAPLDWSLS
jgi:uracil-DNA glycosylase